MKLFGKKFALVLALVAVLVSAVCAFAEEPPYIKIGENIYKTEEEIAKVFNPGDGVVTDGCTIEVYGEVGVPFGAKTGSHDLSGQSAFAVIANSDVTVQGMTDDAVLYPNEAQENGAWGTQNAITIFGDNVKFSNLTVMPKLNSNGDTNKTIEVLGSGFKIENCTFTANTKLTPPSTDGGSLYFNGNGGNDSITGAEITGCTFHDTPVVFDSVATTDVATITGCTFDELNEESGYCIGNVSWSDCKTMGTVNVNGCTFDKVPDGVSVVLHRLESGTFNLEGNTATNADGTESAMTNLVGFGQYDDSVMPSAENSIINVTENNGGVYKLTPSITDGKLDAEPIIETVKAPAAQSAPAHSGGGSGGCSAGFGALALLAAVPLLFRRKK